MITRNALYDFIDDLITAAGVGEPLDGATIFRNVRGSVDQTLKVVRVECLDGQFCMTSETKRKELNVQFTIQCWVKPAGTEQSDLDNAVDDSFEMARVIFEAMAGDTSLGGSVCDSYADAFETGEANLGTVRRGVTYIDGLINQAS